MRITDLLNINSIDLNGMADSKNGAIDHLIDLMDAGGNLADKETYRKGVLAREAEGSTGIGEGIAIPHAKTAAVTKAGLAAMVAPKGIEFDSLDGEPAKLFFLIAAPDTSDNVHLDVLSRLSMLLMDDNFRAKLFEAKTVDEFLQAIETAETIKFPEGAEAVVAPPAATTKRPYVLAVTACPTGIAHTYMAAESLQDKAAKLGIDIKVETNGSGGVKDELTKTDIQRAMGIIVAADTEVAKERFAGKPVLFTKVSDGISKADALLKKITSGRVPIYRGTGARETEESTLDASESVGRQIYKHLMNGVSHMLPFVIGGGIMIAMAFLFDMGNAGTSQFGSGTPVAAFLKTIGGMAFNMMMPILAGYIAMSIGDRPALMPGIVGGFLATSGGSGFFGALFAGFIGGYLILGLGKLFSRLPRALEGTKPILLFPVLSLLLMGLIMVYVVNPPTSVFNQWLAATLTSMSTVSRVVLGFILGGMMSIDFGGPINKAAYVFGTASLVSASGTAVSSGIMAAVMVGGMVPPIAIALCTVFFKHKFTKKERQSGVTNFIMGLSFITEGAIPFAASDPLRVIPSCAIGAAVAGALSMLFNCTVPAPHGGIFVFGVVTNWPMYLLSLAVGAVIGMIILGILKKRVVED